MIEHPQFNKYFPIALNDVFQERLRQLSLWGDNDFDEKTPAEIQLVLVEEVGEVAKAILEGDEIHMEKEIAEVAAVAVKWLEDIARRKAGKMKYEGDITNLRSPSLFNNRLGIGVRIFERETTTVTSTRTTEWPISNSPSSPIKTSIEELQLPLDHYHVYSSEGVRACC